MEDLDFGGADVLRLVGFRIEHWRFAVRLAQVKTSMLPCPITQVFHTPSFVQGIISLHGAIVCVLDFGSLLGLRSTGAKYRRFLVVSNEGVEAALPVHDVFRIPEVAASQLVSVPPHVPLDNRALLEGVINTSSLGPAFESTTEDTITLVDVASMFDAPPIRALRGLGPK
ncbi:MAG: chemotaxis protein CheW [Myxococcota bacterium]